jgi:hypothetical protein
MSGLKSCGKHVSRGSNGLGADIDHSVARRLDAIEVAVKKMKVPASFADQFYGRRGHIDSVRSRLAKV